MLNLNLHNTYTSRLKHILVTNLIWRTMSAHDDDVNQVVSMRVSSEASTSTFSNSVTRRSTNMKERTLFCTTIDNDAILLSPYVGGMCCCWLWCSIGWWWYDMYARCGSTFVHASNLPYFNIAMCFKVATRIPTYCVVFDHNNITRGEEVLIEKKDSYILQNTTKLKNFMSLSFEG